MYWLDETTGDGNGEITYTAQTMEQAISDTSVTVTQDVDNGTYTVQKSIALDFADCGFTEPGIYRYIITESGTNIGVQNDSVPTRTIDVYVVDDTTNNTTKKLKISGYAMHSGAVTGAPTVGDPSNIAGAAKSEGFQNTYPSNNLTFSKEVTGNQIAKSAVH